MPARHHVTAFAALVLAAALSGCGGGGSTGQPAGATDASTVGSSAFVSAYRKAFPDLAIGRKDKPIMYDAENTCLDVQQGTDTATLTKHVMARFTAQDGTVPTAAEAAAILALVRKEQCP
jgi:hypothetical protein